MNKIFLLSITTLLSSFSAQADDGISAIKKVDSQPGYRFYEVTTRVCNNAFPTVTKNLEVIAEDKVVTSFDVFAGSCTKDKRVPANFIVFVSDDELSALGVNPDQARLFFEVNSFDN